MKLLVIGGGPGGHVAAIKAAELGADVTLVEKVRLGGTCLNVGCIPTKVLLHATELLAELRHVDDMGLSVKGAELDFKKLQVYKNKIMDNLSNGVAGLMEAKKIEVLYGVATLTDLNHAKVVLHSGGERDIKFDKAILATGSEVSRIPIPGADADCVVTSDEVLSFSEIPKSMVIIGGGVIGLEFAELYSRLGTKITIIEVLDRILPNMDTEITSIVKGKLQNDGIDIYTSGRVLAIEKTSEGGSVKFSTEEGELAVTAEKVLMAVGRRPYTAGLAIEELDIETERGAIKVNEYMRTNLPHIYAIGDCTGGMMLAHVSSAQAIAAAKNAVLGDTERYSNKTTPSCVYLEPEFASVGLTEEQATKQYKNVKVGKWDLSGNAKVMLMGKDGIIKFVTDGDTGKVLGLHILAPRASDMIHEGALALAMDANIDDIVNTIHAHPTIAESIGEAAHDVHGNAIYKLYTI